MKAWRASLLYFAADFAATGQAAFERDGLLVVGPRPDGRQVVQAVGSFDALSKQFAEVPVEHHPGHLIAPGFIDMHVHFPQIDVIGSPAEGLLPWLENYTFPEEKRFADHEHRAQAATFFIAELLRNGVTTALAFASSHAESVDALLAEAQKNCLRLIAGKVLMDQNAPDGVRDDTEQSLIDTETLIRRWHGVDRLGYAITPRFAPTSTDAQLREIGRAHV